MHSLFVQVLVNRNLSKAGNLFSLDDKIIVQDLQEVLTAIQKIISQCDFLLNHNDQSLVEICVTRITSAIRETETIEKFASVLVSLLETCLCYNLRPTNSCPDSPHAKIASDIMSCLFLNYNNKNVVELAVPVSVKFLHKGNKELSRNMSSYLSLAAIENAHLLALHIQPIIDSVISGNYSLARVLPQIYNVNRDPIKTHTMTLVSILPNCENNEKLPLLSLFNLIAKDTPLLLETSVAQLGECLSCAALTAAATLQIFHHIANVIPSCLSDLSTQIQETAQQYPKTSLTAIQILCSIAKIKQEKAEQTLNFAVSVIFRMDVDKHSLVLKEIFDLVAKWPVILNSDIIDKISSLEVGGSPSTCTYIQQLRGLSFHNTKDVKLPSSNLYNNSINDATATPSNGVTGSVTVVKVPGAFGSDFMGPIASHRQQTGLHASSNMPHSYAHHELCRGTVAGLSQTTTDSSRVFHSAITRPSRADSRSTSRFASAYRSMTRLNLNPTSVGRASIFEKGDVQSSTGLNKSMTRLNSSHQSMARFNFSQAAVTQPTVLHQGTARSITCISGGGRMFAKSPNSPFVQGSISPTKSMSSGSMVEGLHSGATQVLRVNVDKINEDLARQLSIVQLSSNHALPFTSAASFVASRRASAMPYTSGALSLGLNNAQTSISTPPPRSSCTLPSPRKRAGGDALLHYQDVVSGAGGSSSSRSNELVDSAPEVGPKSKEHNRISVFEPYPLRDTVQHFCDKHLSKIKCYMESLSVKLPLPVKCIIEERKGKKHAKINFNCQGRSEEYCLYKSTFYAMRTRFPKTWIHLMFLALQARSDCAISTRENSVGSLKNCWEVLKCESISFVTLVTGAFPPTKDQDALLNELHSHRFFDVFEYNGPARHWGCFLCNHPDRVKPYIQDSGTAVIEGQLKEKRVGRWHLFKKWKNRYFTLSGETLSYKETKADGAMGGAVTLSLDVGSIRSVKVFASGSGGGNRKRIPKAFEIFTNDRKFVLKAKDGSNAQEWMQCISVAKAHSQSRDSVVNKMVAYGGGSLGRLCHDVRKFVPTKDQKY